jgi:hypothetical protein
MTQQSAQHICDLATALYGAVVDTRVDVTVSRGRPGYRAIVHHRQINRRISLTRMDDWFSLKDAWDTVLQEEERMSR